MLFFLYIYIHAKYQLSPNSVSLTYGWAVLGIYDSTFIVVVSQPMNFSVHSSIRYFFAVIKIFFWKTFQLSFINFDLQMIFLFKSRANVQIRWKKNHIIQNEWFLIHIQAYLLTAFFIRQHLIQIHITSS